MNAAQLSPRQLVAPVAMRWLFLLLALGILLFAPAWTFDYWQAWVYVGVVFVPFTCAMIYLVLTDPALVERRMRTREREPQQKWVQLLTGIWFMLIFVFPGLDKRLGWSSVPPGFVLGGDVVVLLGYLLVFLVLRENSYASRVVEVEAGQRVISSGPYALVRHPMYLGVLAMYLPTSLALGSYWGLIVALPLIPLMGARMLNEEKVLSAELPGYREYMQKVRYRLIPGLW